MTPPVSWLSSILPSKHERTAFTNILLLGSLPPLVYVLHLVALPATLDIDFAEESTRIVLFYAVLCFSALLVWRRLLRSDPGRARVARARAALGRWGGAAAGTLRARPLAALWLAACLGVLVSCYPVVFGGKSFVSPNLVSELFYPQTPSLPHAKSTQFENQRHVDAGAMLWCLQPYSVIESQAVFHDHELPVWNRYNSGGITLIGQGQSMIGDPLNWLVVLTGGSAWAWDLKFLLARLLFAAGIGLCVRAATGRLAGALLLAFSACFLDFFAYRLNHPVNFALCYAPWLLLPWLQIVHGEWSVRRAVRCGGLLLLACWMEFCSGSVKETTMLLVCLNGMGLLIVLLDDRRSWRWKGRTLAAAAAAGGCFVLASAPLWRTLLESLAHAWNYYEHAPIWQLQPILLISLFDDAFACEFNEDKILFDPSANFVVLLGVAFALASCQTLARRHRSFLVLGLGCLPLLALVFGGVPSPWIRAVPFLGKVMHIDSTFITVLLVPMTLLAGFGLERLRQQLGEPRWGGRYAAFAAVPVGLLALYLGGVQAVQQSQYSPLHSLLPISSFFKGYVCTLMVALLALPLLLRWWQRHGLAAAPGAIPMVALCLGTLLWRGGLQERAVVGWDQYVMHVGPRQETRIDSPAVRRLQAATRESPGRVFGLRNTLVGGYASVFGLETPYGPDALENRYFHRLLEVSPVRYAWGWLWQTDSRAAASRMRRIYDMLNIRFYADRPAPGTAAPPEIRGLRTVGRDDLDLYESPTAWPRAFFTDVLLPSSDNRDFLDRVLNDDTGRPFAAVELADLTARTDATAFVPLMQPPPESAARAVVPAVDYRLTSRTTSFRVQAPGPGVAVLLEGYQEPYNVQVYLDGRPAVPLRVNGAFMGIRVPGAGEHQVRVVYGPRDLPLLLGVSALGLTLLAAAAWWILRRDRPGKVHQRENRQPVPSLPVDRPARELVAAP